MTTETEKPGTFEARMKTRVSEVEDYWGECVLRESAFEIAREADAEIARLTKERDEAREESDRLAMIGAHTFDGRGERAKDDDTCAMCGFGLREKVHLPEFWQRRIETLARRALAHPAPKETA